MRTLLAVALLLAAPAAAQTPVAPAAAPPVTSAAPPAPPAAVAYDWRTLEAANTLLIETTKGKIYVEMRPDLAPLTVARIKALTRSGYYNGALFYRVIKGFMAQTGDKGDKQYRSTLPNLKGEMTFALTPQIPYASAGSVPGGDVGFVGTVPVNIAGVPAGQAATAGRGNIVFCPGVVAMAHPANQPNGGNSQFFLMRGPGSTLEKAFAAWGRVVIGQDVVEAIKNGEPPVGPDKMTRLRILSDIPPAQRPKVEVANLTGATLATTVATAAQAKGAAFTLCDVPVGAKVTG